MFGFTRRRRHHVGSTHASTLGDERRGTQVATFAAGCFWGVESRFREIEGVCATRVGFTGGAVPEPSYQQVCRSDTGHAEAVEVTFDPGTVSYEQLLDTFWKIHNPTSRNRQGWDVGSQYRSAIFVYDADQMTVAAASRDRVQQSSVKRVVTGIEAAGPFYEAEEYHQQYLDKRRGGSCAVAVKAPPSVCDAPARG